jgi:hypothetical protein
MNDIIWDIDGVLSDFTFGFKKFVRRFHDIPLAPCGAKKSWQFRGLAQAEEDEIWRRIAAGKYDWSLQSSLLTAGDWHGIRDLKDAGTTFQYITSRLGPAEQVIEQTVRWLREEGFPDYENVTLSSDKVAAIKVWGYEPVALIDDDIRNIYAYMKLYSGTFVRDWQYNRKWEVVQVHGADSNEAFAAQHAHRVSSVSEFCYAALESIDGIDRG